MDKCVNCGEDNATIKLENSFDWWHCTDDFPNGLLCKKCDDRDKLISDTEGRFEYSIDMTRHVIDLEKQLAEAQARLAWVSVEDIGRLPKEGEWCQLIDNGNRLYGMLWWKDGNDLVWKAMVMKEDGAWFMAVNNVTYHMPLPQPPKDK